ncbi:hypothetical protein F4677DRAFT_450542 [Hypoxylon crocopeplum]|nr:hypothetical protein F4677DRAFT_450542 [Hypoxylon crocopeplum]
MPRLDGPDDYCSRLKAEKDAREATVRNQLISKLQENGLLSDEQMGLFKRDAVAHYDNQLVQKTRSTRRQQREIEAEFDKMEGSILADAVVDYIQNHVSNDRCIQVYEDVISVISSDRIRPASEHNPHENPETPFSVSRAAPESTKSNAELIDALASATNMEPRLAISIRSQITLLDSMDNSNGGLLHVGSGRVTGGRLGRNHMLGDVPNHHVRDRLMDYINTMLEEDQRDDAKKAKEIELDAMDPKPRPLEDTVGRIVGTKSIKSASEAAQVARQAALMSEINTKVGMTAKPGFGFRDYDRLKPISRSVAWPHRKQLTEAESELDIGKDIGTDIGTDIDMDCDQIRAMIARLTSWNWTADQFRLVLGGVTRPQLTNFLEQRGPEEGKDSAIFQLGWEFFKRRRMILIPSLDGGDILRELDALRKRNADLESNALRERDVNTTKKRPSTGGEKGKASRKRTRRT